MSTVTAAYRSRLTPLAAPGHCDKPVASDRGVTVDGPCGLGDLVIDTAQGAPCPVIAVLVIDDPIGNAANLLGAGGRPRPGEECPSGMSWPTILPDAAVRVFDDDKRATG